MPKILVFNTKQIDFYLRKECATGRQKLLHPFTSSFYNPAIRATDRREQQLQCVDIHHTRLSLHCKNRLYSQAYVMEKLFPILTIST